ncbi:MAG: hypothetical protein K0S54_1000 [Alphaproteobacteria bacterium]|jgi:hypothetical protein|nr:hypothetical protein [Alphaproteobacteria bacterium]
MARPSLIRFLPALILALSAVFLAPRPASATTLADVYTVTGVPIDATAANAQQARDQAIVQGQRRAARLLLERLALRSDRPRLPQLDANALTNLVSGFQVANERTSPVRYLADLSVSFRPEAVRTLMRDAGIAVADTPSPPVLLLPIWRSGNDLMLFDERSPWREAWLKVATGKGLVPLLTPLGDIGDLQAISAEQAVRGDLAALTAIAQRYGTAAVMVAQASPGANETIDQLIVTRYPVGGGTAQRVAVTPRRPPEALLATAIAISQEVEESWKASSTAAAAVDAGPGAALEINVPVRQLGEWIAIRKQLGTVPAVKTVAVRSLGVGAALISVQHAGTPQQLQAALAQADLILTEEAGGWVLRAKTAAQPRPQ